MTRFAFAKKILIALCIGPCLFALPAAYAGDTTISEPRPRKIRMLEHVNDPIQRPLRDIRSTWPFLPAYLGDAAKAPNPDYVLQPDDVIEIVLVADIPPADMPKLNVYYNDMSVALINDVRRPKIPASLLPDLEQGPVQLVFRITDPTDLRAIVLTSGLAVPGSRWADAQKAMQSATFKAANGTTDPQWTIRARLIPVASEHASPGDIVEVHRLLDDDGREQRVEHFSLRVDRDGFLWIPPLTTGLANPKGNMPARAQPNIRRMHGAVDRSYFRVRVADPLLNVGRLSLNRIADELSSLSFRFDSNDLTRWQAFGIDEQYLPREGETAGVRYHFVLGGPRSWTLVDEDGNRLTIPHRGRELLVESVLTAYTQLTGRELLDRPHTSIAYLTVFPANQREPFYGRTDVGDPHSELKYLALLSGDTVFISRRKPVNSRSSLP